MPAQTQLSWVTLFNYRLLQSSRLLCTSQVSSLPSSTKFLESQLAGSALALVVLSVTKYQILVYILKEVQLSYHYCTRSFTTIFTEISPLFTKITSIFTKITAFPTLIL